MRTCPASWYNHTKQKRIGGLRREANTIMNASFFLLCAAAYAAMAAPLRAERKTPFEQLLGTQGVGFRMMAVISGLLLVLGGVGYLYLTMTTVEEDAAGWAQALELAYAGITVLAGLCSIGLAKAQGVEMTSHSALLTLAPLLWSCLHLLVNYRMTCVDPKLPSFGFGLVGDILLVLAFTIWRGCCTENRVRPCWRSLARLRSRWRYRMRRAMACLG